MKYKAKLSPKQMFGFRGATHKAVNGIFDTDDPKVIEFLKDNPNWIAQGKSEIKSEKEEDKKSKKGGKK